MLNDTNFKSTPEETLCQAIILQAIKDYYDGWMCKTGQCGCKKAKNGEAYLIHKTRIREMAVVKSWVVLMSGSFKTCAMGWNKAPHVLQEMMLNKIKAIQKGEELKAYD